MLYVKANISPDQKANLSALDKIIAAYKQKIQWMRMTDKDIKKEEGNQLSISGRPNYEEGYPESFGLKPDMFRDLLEEEVDKGGLGVPEDIDYMTGGPPTSDGVFKQLMSKAFEAFDKLYNPAKALDAIIDEAIQDHDSAPMQWAYKLVDQMEEFADMMDAAVDQFQSVRNQWEEEAHNMSEQQLDGKNEDTMVGEGSRSLLYIRSLAETADKAYEAVKQAAGAKTTAQLKHYLKIFAQAQETIKNAPGITHSDIAAIQSQIGDLSEIANRAFFSDIRSWNGRAIQQQDALHLFTTMKLHWLKRLESLEADVKANKGGMFAGVPSYRFKIGQMVRVNSSRRYGKVLGISRKGGTGTQQYEVRVNGIDSTRIFSVRELSKVD